MVDLSEITETSSNYSSTNNAHNNYQYDVFLSFRGVDTRNNFADHLYNALKYANITTFLDDEEIETGEVLKPELEDAIKSSRASIIVLSKNYATSTWCLDELVLILEQRLISGHIVIPIFYHVEPTDVRKQQKSFGDAMAGHRRKMEAETDPDKRRQWWQNIDRWKKALKEVADLKGMDVKGRRETVFIEGIVKEMYRRLGQPLRTNLPQLIGREHSIELITSWLKDGSSHKADILTIFGIGGMGKTSLARYVYLSHSHEFCESSFINDIGRTCVGKFNGLLDLQKQLCGDISKTGPVDQVHDVLTYTSTVENALVSKKVFLVLDDINSPEQLNALLGNKGFHPGSKIIITTEDASLTEGCALFKTEIFEPKHTKHFLGGLVVIESLRLLCRHAFKCEEVKEGYEEVSDAIVKFCDGHPFALEVLGELICNRDVAYCKDKIRELKEEPGFSDDMEIRVSKSLRMSIDSLSKNDKELLKYVACFFVGEDRDYAETILKACGIKTTSGITNLIDRCLLRIQWGNELTMHSLIQKIGRDEVDSESPDPEMRSLLWRHKDSYKVLKKKKGTGKIKGLTLDMRMIEKEKLRGSLFEMKTDALSKMDNLKLLQLNLVQLNGSYKNFPHKLRWLCLRFSPLESFPSDLPMKKLVALDLSYSNIKSFDISCSNPQRPGERQKLIGSSSKDEKLLRSLKVLHLSYCDQLQSLGGFCEFPALERLYLRNCKSLVDVCETIGQCLKLVCVDLSYCNKCEKLLRNIHILKNVNTLFLDGCNLGELPCETRDMYLAKIVDANNIDVTSLTFSGASSLEAIPRDSKSLAISLRRSLVTLSLANNNLSNESFPMDFSCLSMLKELFLDANPIVSMPKCVRCLPKLEILTMYECKLLTSIKYPPRTLRVLTTGCDDFRHIETLRKVVFHPEMSPLRLLFNLINLPYSSIEVEGMVKIQPMAGVEETVLRALGWTNLDFINKRRVGTYRSDGGLEGSQTQMMYYEFGIFSTIYGGKAMPNWIRCRSKGPLISFTIPSSPKKQLRGLNFCCVQRRMPEKNLPYSTDIPVDQLFFIPMIKISNETKNCTWIYDHCVQAGVNEGEGGWLTYLSHWMFGKNDMETGDEVTIVIVTKELLGQLTEKCGVSFVYDDGSVEEEKEDALDYYKSWNHIIGGDLSAFQLTTGEYLLRIYGLVRYDDGMTNVMGISAKYKETEVLFKAFSQRKSSTLVCPGEDVTK